MTRFILPFIVFVVLVIFLFIGLRLDPREVPSPLVGKPAPVFVQPQLGEASKVFSPADMKGKVWLMNVWASWCVSCEAEHPVLMELSKLNLVPIIGLDYKDKPEAAMQVLNQRGNPYSLVATDRDGRTGIDYGVYGVPETYVIDKQGIIQYKLIGPVNPKNLKETILPMVAELEKK